MALQSNLYQRRMAYTPDTSTPLSRAQINHRADYQYFSLSTLWEQIKEDWVAHGYDWTKPGFRAVFAHRFGVWRMGIQIKLLRSPLSLLYRMMG